MYELPNEEKVPASLRAPTELFFGSALTRAAAECEPLSFAAYELAVRLEHIEVSPKLAGDPMHSAIANGAFSAANCAFRAISAPGITTASRGWEAS